MTKNSEKSGAELANAEQTPGTMAAFAAMGQEGIPGMLELVKKQISALKKGQVGDSSTKGKNLPGFGEISKITKVSDLIKAHSSVVNRAKAYAESASTLGLKTTKFPFKLDGCTEKQWVTDIEAAASILANKAELDKLAKTKKLLEDNLSAEAKLKNDLAKIGTMFTDDSPVE